MEKITSQSAGPSASLSHCPPPVDTVLSVIGNTPLVRLNKICPPHIKCNIWAKCEFFNAGGSVKDRIGLRMIDDAEKSGRIKPGDTLIEPTSGNTGIGMALAAAVRGYKCIIVLPEKMSKEKVDVLKALGAEIIRTPTEAAWDAPDSHISIAKKLQKETPNSHILDQYTNPANPLAHYDGTAVEILQQLDGQVDMFVAGAGTGGTISGVAAKIKERCPNAEIVGVDPVGSILALPDSMNDAGRLDPYHVEGIGYDFIPGVLDRSLVDTWMKSNDCESLVMMRSLIRNEGLLCGGSSGAAVSCAIKAASKLKEGQNCVVILPDSVRNYMTKALSDEWMVDHNFIDNEIIKKKLYQNWWANKRVCDLELNTPLTISWNVKCKEAIALLKREGFDMVPVLDAEGDILGVVTEGNMTRKIINGTAQPNASVADAGVVYKTFRKLGMNASLSDLASALDIEPYVLIITEQRCYARKRRQRSPSQESESDPGAKSAESNDEIMAVVNKSVVSGIVTRIDLLEFIARGE
jgi:cystathionine beta-synthase